MFLRCIDLVGFKSFAHKTHLEFERGMTAIVGPNGCGKSNIADAVRWVLGEQSAKSLRGGTMQDVIFNGAAKLDAVGMAEVSLTFADCEETLKQECNEVTITRRLFRSGEGQYLINRKGCRLKDIQNLFMNTGIGSHAYTVLQQGRIDQILSSHPEDRRIVFEEASGITRYKSDKKEALRKLDQTNANMQRLDDIIGEVKRSMNSLQRQASKATRFKDYTERVKKLDLCLSRHRFMKLSRQWDQLTASQEISEAEHARLTTVIHSLERQIAELRTIAEELDNDYAIIMESSMRAGSDADRGKQSIEVCQRRLRELMQHKERDATDAVDAEEQLCTCRDQYQTQLLKQKEAAERTAIAEDCLVQIRTVYDAARQQAHEHKAALTEMRKEQMRLDREQTVVQQDGHKRDVQLETYAAQIQRMASEKQAVQEHITSARNRLDALDAEKAARQQLLNTMQGDLDVLGEKKAIIVAQKKALDQDLKQKEQNVATAKAQYEFLAVKYADERSIFPAGARCLIVDKSPCSEHLGTAQVFPLIDELKPEKGYELALEVVLRSVADALFITESACIPALLDRMKSDSLGSVRLLCAPAVNGTPPDASVPGIPLFEKVQCGERIHAVLQRLLMNVRVIRRWEDIPADNQKDITWVTRDGCLLNPVCGVAEYWCPDANSVNPMAQRRQLQEKKGVLAALQSDMVDLQQLLEETRGAMDETSAAMRALEEEQRRHQKQLAHYDGEIAAVRSEYARFIKRSETIQSEMKQRAQALAHLQQQREASEKICQKLTGQCRIIQQSIEEQQQALDAFEKDVERHKDAVTEARIAHSSHKNAWEACTKSLLPLQQQMEQLQRIADKRRQGCDSYQQQIDAMQNELMEHERAYPVLVEKHTALRKRLVELKTEREHHEQQGCLLIEDMTQKRTRLECISKQCRQNELSRTEIRVKRDNLCEHARQEYEEDLFELKMDVSGLFDFEQQDESLLEKEISTLRAQIHSMGPVNLCSIEEYNEQKERFAFLADQKKDLMEAHNHLSALIQQINQKTAQMFAETFEQINRYFQTLFTQLFGGGEARLQLMDENDILDCGIDIIARPPGKKRQNISLLSGGERTMTAVALLFALYQVKPGPFCLLDELDAALDDTNIGRFVKTVRAFVEHSQFIVITHSRQTIAAADMLYGITMEQRGISTLVSLRLDEHKQRTKPMTETNRITFKQIPQ
ncbi:MAG: chromosome segregation protein SMC [Spartobacteria bacterium]|nr:chromosome segregation protein SMC [Spartobacteria bacterium]